MTKSFDVVILGSGFAGSLLGTILARHGRRVAVIDRGTHPRFTIGESSTPTADLLLAKLTRQHGLAELEPLVTFGSWQRHLPHVACGCKRGFSYLWHGDDDGFRATPNHDCELLVAATSTREQADTQWYRSDVDTLFAAVAERYGVTLFQQTHVQEITHTAAYDWLIETSSDERRESMRAEVVVDASGPSGVLLRTMRPTDITSLLRTHTQASYSHFLEVPSAESWLRDCGALVHEYPYAIDDSAVHHLFREGWLWQLRFESGITSLGWVSRWDQCQPPMTWDTVLGQHPVLKSLLGRASLAKVPGRVLSTARLQRLSARGAGADWAALPFTVGFIDPLHSTGIAHSLSGVDRLSEILLGEREEWAERLELYSTSVVSELRHIDRMIAGCYEGLADFRLFGAWTMVYFAAATTSERRWLEWFGHPPGSPTVPDPSKAASASAAAGVSAVPSAPAVPGFLCADDEEFVATVEHLLRRLDAARASGEINAQRVDELVDEVRHSLAPFNHVGLFRPQLPNLYHRTAVVQ